MALSTGEMLRRWFEEVWNQRDTSRIGHYLAPDAVIRSLGMAGEDVQGHDAFRAFQDGMLASFPDLQFALHEVADGGALAAIRWTAEGTHRGDGLGVAATGERVAISGMTMGRASGGRIVEAWNEWDRIRMATTCRMLATK
jgi:steroid delta-isomerase-like uncharacterized protein